MHRRLRLLKRLIEGCPYHNGGGLLIGREQREIQKMWSLTGKLPDYVFTEAYTVEKITSTIHALGNVSFDDIAAEMDTHTASLALLRFLLLKDTVNQCNALHLVLTTLLIDIYVRVLKDKSMYKIGRAHV